MKFAFQLYYSYYGCTILFDFICSSIAVCIGLFNKNKFPALKIFYLYPLASLLQIIIAVFFPLFDISVKEYNHTTNIAANIFMTIEFLLIYNFFRKVLQSKTIQLIMNVMTAAYLLIILVNWIIFKYFFYFPGYIFTLQAIFLLIPGLYYFFELFKYPVFPDLLKEFSFWVSLGIVFYFSCTLPIFLLKDWAYRKTGVINETSVYSINFICYGFLFLFIAKAYLCPKRDTP